MDTKDAKCPKCKKHCFVKYLDGKECTSCGYIETALNKKDLGSILKGEW